MSPAAPIPGYAEAADQSSQPAAGFGLCGGAAQNGRGSLPNEAVNEAGGMVKPELAVRFGTPRYGLHAQSIFLGGSRVAACAPGGGSVAFAAGQRGKGTARRAAPCSLSQRLRPARVPASSAGSWRSQHSLTATAAVPQPSSLSRVNPHVASRGPTGAGKTSSFLPASYSAIDAPRPQSYSQGGDRWPRNPGRARRHTRVAGRGYPPNSRAAPQLTAAITCIGARPTNRAARRRFPLGWRSNTLPPEAH